MRRRRAPLSAARAAFAALAALLLAGCWNGRILFSFEQPFWSTFGENSRAAAAIFVNSAERGYLPAIEIGGASADPLAPLLSSIAAKRYTVVVVGPLVSLQWQEYVSRSPETRFVLIGAAPPVADPPSNAVFLTFDRTSAFRDAGRAAAASAHTASHIAILASEDAGMSAEETEAFSRGVAASLDGGRPVLFSLPAPVDRNSVQAAVDRLRRGGAAMYLLDLGEHNPLALEVLRDAGGTAVVADWQASGALSEQVFASVEEDVPGGITRALDALNGGVHLVQGPVRLVRGKKI